MAVPPETALRGLPPPLGSADIPREGPDGQAGHFCRGISWGEVRGWEGADRMKGIWADWRTVGMRDSLLARLCVQMRTNVHEWALSLCGAQQSSVEGSRYMAMHHARKNRAEDGKLPRIMSAAALRLTSTGSHLLFQPPWEVGSTAAQRNELICPRSHRNDWEVGMFQILLCSTGAV